VLFVPHEGEGIQLAIQRAYLVDPAVMSGGIKRRTEKSFICRVRDDFYLASPMIRK